MNNYPFGLMDSQVNSSFVSDFSSFINEVCEGYTNNFTTNQIFLTHNDLIKFKKIVTLQAFQKNKIGVFL